MKIVLDDGAYMPERAHPTDAGLDLKTPYDVKIPARGSACIDTGVHLELPNGYFGKIEGKSGLNVHHGIVSLGGVIDEQYTGSIAVKLYNMTDRDYWFQAGDKISQLVIMPYMAPILIPAERLSETERGSQGFGSTGR